MFGSEFWRFGPQPFRELYRLQRDINRIFTNMEELVVEMDYPAINTWAGEKGAIVTAELPGIEPDKVDISIKRDMLTLSGKREPETLKSGAFYHRQERNHGQFSRIIKLPFTVDAEKVDASYKNGILKIILNRAAEEIPKKIAIKGA